MTAALLVRVNLAACSGLGDCARICPEAFSLDRYGYPLVREFDQGDADIRARVREAGCKCPQAAIFVEEVAPQC